jgi:hypothetical protein
MPGYGEADIIQELEAQIARLTAELNSSMRWKRMYEAVHEYTHNLESATRRVVEALHIYVGPSPSINSPTWTEWREQWLQARETLESCLKDPVLATLRRE